MGWPVVVGVIALVLLLAISPLVWLWARRRWLSRSTTVFDCSLRSGSGEWILGAGRYDEGRLEWFRVFSVSLRPERVIVRSNAHAMGTRCPDPDEAMMLYDNDRIVKIHIRDEECELALDEENLTGLLSWLEAAPPGSRIL